MRPNSFAVLPLALASLDTPAVTHAINLNLAVC